MAIHTQSGAIIYPTCPGCGQALRSPLQIAESAYTITTRHRTSGSRDAHRIAVQVNPDGSHDGTVVPSSVYFEDVLMGRSTLVLSDS